MSDAYDTLLEEFEQPDEYDKLLAGYESKPKLSAGYYEIINRHAQRTGIDPKLVKAVMAQESSGNRRAVSPKGASGLMQLMPATAKRFGVKNIFDPEENIRAGTDYLKFLSDRYQGNIDLILAGYNAGEGAVDKFKGIPPYKETQNYVPSVKARIKGQSRDAYDELLEDDSERLGAESPPIATASETQFTPIEQTPVVAQPLTSTPRLVEPGTPASRARFKKRVEASKPSIADLRMADEAALESQKIKSIGQLRQIDDRAATNRNLIREQVKRERYSSLSPIGAVRDVYNAARGISTEQDIESEVNRQVSEQQDIERIRTEQTAEEIEQGRKLTEQLISRENFVSKGLDKGSTQAVSSWFDTLAGAVNFIPTGTETQQQAVDYLRRQALIGQDALAVVNGQYPQDIKEQAVQFLTNFVFGDLPKIQVATGLGGAVSGFAGLGAVEARGRDAGLVETVSEAGKGAAIGKVFQSAKKLEKGDNLFLDTLRSGAGIGAGTFGVETAFGATPEEAGKAALTNIGFHAVGAAQKGVGRSLETRADRKAIREQFESIKREETFRQAVRENPELTFEQFERTYQERPSEAGFLKLRQSQQQPLTAIEQKAQQVFTPEPVQKKSISQRVKQAATKLQTELVSEFTPVRNLEAEIYRREGKQIEGLDMARRFELQAGASAKAEADIAQFKEAISPANRFPEEFQRYLFAKRTIDRLSSDPSRKRVGNWTLAEAQQLLADTQARVGPEGVKRLEAAGQAFQQETRRALQLQVKSGRMSPKVYDRIIKSNDFYAPFKVLKYLSEAEAKGGTGRSMADARELAKAIKGISSDDFKLGNFLVAAGEQIVKSRILAEKNLKMQKFAKLADFGHTDLISQVKASDPVKQGFERLPYLENGVTKYLEVQPYVYRAVQGLNPYTSDLLMKTLSITSKPFRYGATTLSIPFQARNLFFADLPRAALVSKYGLGGGSGVRSIPKAIIDIPRFTSDWIYSLAASLKGNFGGKSDLYEAFRKSGAANTGYARQMTPEAFTGKTSIGQTNPIKKAFEVPFNFANAIEETSKLLGMKRGLRMENFDKLSPEQQRIKLEEIASEVRNFSGSPDFARHGAAFRLRELNQLFMFLNARIQGQAADFSKLVGRNVPKGQRAAAAIAVSGKLLTAVGLPSLALSIYNHLYHKEDLESLPEWERDSAWFIFRDSTFVNEKGETVREAYKIPKREISGLIGNTTESFVDFLFNNDPNAFAELAENTIENISPINIQGEGLSLQDRLASIVSGMHPDTKSGC